MTDREIQSAVDDIAVVLGSGVSLDDLTGRLVAYSVQCASVDDARVRALLHREVPEEIRRWESSHGTDTAVDPIVIPGNDTLKMQPRICIPLIHRGVRTGLLYIIDPAAPRQPERLSATVDLVAEHLGLLAALLYDMASPQLNERTRREQEFLAACHGDPAALTGLATWPAIRSASGLRVAVSVFSTGSGVHGISETRSVQMRLTRQQAVSRHPPVIVGSVQDSHLVVLLRPGQDADAALLLHQRLSATTGSSAAADHLYTGIAERFSAVEALPQAYRRAVIAAQTAAVQPGFGAVASWETIGPYRVIGERMRTDGSVSALLTRLLAGDHTGELATTLEVFYDERDNVKAVADALHLHRTSLYYRLNKIRDILGVDPLDGSVRLELHLALKARRWERRPRC